MAVRLRRLVPVLAERLRRKRPALARAGIAAPLMRSLADRLLRSGLFDAAAYARSLARPQATPLACALHYLREPSPAVQAAQPRFDAARYRAASGLGGRDDLLTYFAVRGRHPEAALVGFDPAAYLQANPDLRLQGCDPIRHYLQRGRWENRWSAGPELELEGDGPDPSWIASLQPKTAAPPQVWVIVPVHDARAKTLLCLRSLLSAACELPHRVLVVDDASSDPQLRAELAALAQIARIDLVTSDTNLGFSAAVNLGLKTCAGCDVVLLNSDTEVFDGWLDRLHRVARSHARVGTVTPLSNSATILSYPIQLRDNPAPLELGWAALDGIFASRSHAPLEAPTAVGFCMYITRACLAETGGLDGEAFPHGYGEENDFCLRAAAGGWRHMVAADTFVAHHGAASFGSRRPGLVAAGLKILSARYPHYRSQVDDFIARDPLAALRLDADVLRQKARYPAGTALHCVRERRETGGLQLVFDPTRGELLLFSPSAPVMPNLPALDVLRRPAQAAELLRRLGATRLMLQDQRWIGPERTRALTELARGSNLEISADG
ncbi:glycosyltransferase family 2 protein [Caulobacter sp. S45]|uniref:glycosyltransferase family 2 protein n=1 Tax=Caulobacter sp. S45 TaxID=1641861 RepID=UPI00157524C3|nr:glycosyltransferase [Caulobacter sp. S45]